MSVCEPLLECGVLWAAQKGDAGHVMELLSSGVSCNVSDADGLTPLHYAARDGHMTLVRQLLLAKASCRAISYDAQYTPLHLAALYDQDDILRVLLMADTCDVNQPDAYGKTVAHYVALRGMVRVLPALMAAGADINMQDSCGWCPLHWACYENQRVAVEALLAAGARTDIKENDCWTPLHWAAFKSLSDIVNLLLVSGADHSLVDNEGFTALYLATLSSNGNQRVRTVKLMLEAGADVNHSGSIGWCPLHRAASDDTCQLTQLLLDAGATANMQNISGDTPLHMATLSGCLDTVHTLIEAGASLSIQDIEWKTPLERAIQTLRPEMLREYLAAGASRYCKPLHVENTVMETIAQHCRLASSPDRDDAVDMLCLLYEAGMLSHRVTKGMLTILQRCMPEMSLKSLVRVCIQQHVSDHNASTYRKLGLPTLLQNYLLYKGA